MKNTQTKGNDFTVKTPEQARNANFGHLISELAKAQKEERHEDIVVLCGSLRYILGKAEYASKQALKKAKTYEIKF